jgi:opacity protein-like surface antigen
MSSTGASKVKIKKRHAQSGTLTVRLSLRCDPTFKGNNMRTSFLIAAAAVCFMSAAVVAQPANPRGDTPAVNTPNSPPNPGAPVAGANSFTEGQAKSRIESNGFSNVTELRKDDQGVWRGKATKDGRSVAVSLDFQGNVTSQ